MLKCCGVLTQVSNTCQTRTLHFFFFFFFFFWCPCFIGQDQNHTPLLLPFELLVPNYYRFVWFLLQLDNHSSLTKPFENLKHPSRSSLIYGQWHITGLIILIIYYRFINLRKHFHPIRAWSDFLVENSHKSFSALPSSHFHLE